MGKRKELVIHLETAPPKYTYTQEDVNKTIKKAMGIVIDDLILNGHLKTSN